MVKQTIQIFARVKPTKAKTGVYECDTDEEGLPRLTFTVPRELADGFINNKRELYKFRFQHVFDQNSEQDDIFDHVAKPVIDNVLQGYNGTIFAYGQTGSGKTFTITGGAERYADRGIIPRTLSYIFEEFEQNSERSYTLHISYLEIYNENGYDLLDPKHEAAKLEDLPKVTLMEDSDQNIHLKNLSVHQATNEEEALNLLFLGDTNRMIAETPMNQASTRSHCIFTIHLTSRESGSATIRRAKLHLVDLAGSERVSKSGVNGILLTEAKYINLSLHYLEQVIISLSEKNRQHIPYRNSMMTSVLRDSLGGNCMTTMIATCSVEKRNLDESISTCRFAQRVAMIKNDVLVNEELDPKLMILNLKREIQQLKEELALATGQQRTDELTDEDLQRCQAAVTAYLEDSDPDAVISVGADMRKIHACFSIMKREVLDKPSVPSRAASKTSEPIPNPDMSPYAKAETQKLKDLVLQRDNEINILVNMLKKEKKRAADALSQLERFGHRPPSARNGSDQQVNGHDQSSHSRSDVSSATSSHGGWSKEKHRLQKEKEEKTKAKILGDMSIGRQEAFEIFRRDYEHNDAIEENKQALKERYASAKALGEFVNRSRSQINHIKAQIEHHRMQMAMQGLVDDNNPEPDEVEQQLRKEMEAEKSRYKESFNKLRNLKTEIEHLQHLLEKSRVKLLKDFELWWTEQASQLQENPPHVDALKSAWQTPPITPEKDFQKSDLFNRSSSSSSSSKLGQLRGSVAGNIATSQRPVKSSDGLGAPPRGPASDKTRSSHSSSGIPLTGDPKADADIMAFIKARQNILQKTSGPR
ncbi:hypothetical protein CHS0354_014591 [Potamilus streckersoni]|uniref:Kinesin-like protein n=1 Tax=Potamilus streckersoni TaxID=2493646 RepID=A0AAE0RNI3_9BIVA|nr:hypothetical protein CHS0354_014591 [Potamilus streckersoni]